jgi:YbbR domain-containing protein
VEIRGLDDNVTAYDVETERVRVGIRAPQSVWENLSSESIHAYIDLSDAATGTLEVPVKVDLDVEPANVTSITPENIALTVESIAEKEIPVTVILQGNPATGFTIRTPNAYEVAPATLRVRGPKSRVDQVVKAQVPVSIDDRQNDVRSDYEPVPVDENENPVPQVEVTPKSVTVHVPIEQLAGNRDIPIKPVLVGELPPGYSYERFAYEPQVVTVNGQADVIRELTTLQTEPLNLEQITQSLTTTVGLQVPWGVSVIQPQNPEVTVTLILAVIRSSLTLEVTPTIQGLDPDLTATVGLDSIVVILSGPLSRMETFDPTTVSVTLNLTNLTPGEYTIAPEVTLPEEIQVENIVPEAVPVKIERELEEIDDFR